MKKANVFKIIYIISYTMMLASFMFSRVTIFPTFINNLKFLGVILLLVIALINSKYKVNELAILLGIFFVLMIVTYITSDKIFLELFCLIVASKNINFDDIVKIDFTIRFAFLIILLILSHYGFTNNFIFIRNGIVRNSMGFSHPNTFAYILTILNLELLYIKKGKINLKIILFGILTYFAITKYADSRTESLLLILIYAIFILYKFVDFEKIFNKKTIKFLTSHMFEILTILSFVFLILFKHNNSFAITLNQILSNRLQSALEFFNSYNINIFGNKLLLISSEQAKLLNTRAYILDNSYFHIILHYGILVYLMFAYIFNISIKECIKSKNITLILIFIVLLIMGLSETYLFKVDGNVFLLYFGNYIFNKGVKNLESS